MNPEIFKVDRQMNSCWKRLPTPIKCLLFTKFSLLDLLNNPWIINYISEKYPILIDPLIQDIHVLYYYRHFNPSDVTGSIGGTYFDNITKIEIVTKGNVIYSQVLECFQWHRNPITAATYYEKDNQIEMAYSCNIDKFCKIFISQPRTTRNNCFYATIEQDSNFRYDGRYHRLQAGAPFYNWITKDKDLILVKSSLGINKFKINPLYYQGTEYCFKLEPQLIRPLEIGDPMHW